MTKHNYLVRNADDLPRVFAEAFHIARTGRPGPGPHRHHEGRPPAGDERPAPDRRGGRRRPARLPPEPRRERPPAQARRPGARQGEAAGDPRRPRRPPRRGLGRPRRVRREDPDPGRPHAARHRRDRRGPSAQLRLHGDARLEARQPGDPVGRPAVRDRDALRRPGHRQRPDLRAVRPDRPRRHRPGRDRQERRGRGPDRRRRGARPRAPSCRWSRRSSRRRGPTTSPSSPSGGANPRASSWHGSGRLARRPPVGRLRRRAGSAS